MVDWLRVSGQFDAIVSAASAKKDGKADSIPLNTQDPEVTTEALLQWYVQQLASPNGNGPSRVTLPYLRKDWEAFLASIVKQHRFARG
jgi:hypothetical protein